MQAACALVKISEVALGRLAILPEDIFAYDRYEKGDKREELVGLAPELFGNQCRNPTVKKISAFRCGV